MKSKLYQLILVAQEIGWASNWLSPIKSSLILNGLVSSGWCRHSFALYRPLEMVFIFWINEIVNRLPFPIGKFFLRPFSVRFLTKHGCTDRSILFASKIRCCSDWVTHEPIAKCSNTTPYYATRVSLHRCEKSNLRKFIY